MKDVTAGTCRVPASGHYADGNGVEDTCNAISDSVTLGGEAVAVANRDSCLSPVRRAMWKIPRPGVVVPLMTVTIRIPTAISKAVCPFPTELPLVAWLFPALNPHLFFHL